MRTFGKKANPTRRARLTAAVLVVVAIPSGFAVAQDRATYNLFGTPGLLDMPSAASAPDAELAATISHMATATRTTLSFQITPRFSGSFRYSGIQNFFAATGAEVFDRSFDLQYRFVDEGRLRPAVAFGLRDFLGTGLYSAEYIVATKNVAPGLTVTGGLGWGRLGSFNGFDNPLAVFNDGLRNRPSDFGFGGNPEFDQWFRGDAAFFGGLAWKATNRLTLKAEYSSDAYPRETQRINPTFNRKSPWNLGLSYEANDSVAVQVAYMYGDQLGFGVTLKTNPKQPTVIGGLAPQPLAITPRAPGAARDLGWTQQANGQAILRDNVKLFLSQDGMTFEAMEVAPQAVTLHFRPGRFGNQAQAVGRAARILARTMPASVENFTLVPVVRGTPMAAVTLRRSDLEALETEPDNSWLSYGRATVSDAAKSLDGATYDAALYPKFRWALAPYITASYFDPDSPIRADVGAALSAEWDLAPGIMLAGRVQKRFAGNRDDATIFAPSGLQRVRSDSNIYAREGDPALTNLTLSWYDRPGTNVYSRVTVGYLEPMFGGISGEMLWKPVDSRLALGAEINYVQQRDFDQQFGFRDYQTATGHLSAYYAFGNGFQGTVDAGRYLAGDWGASFALDRTFANGWSIGAYATFTNVSAEDFGEGSFDKGLRFTIPLEAVVGTPSSRRSNSVIRSLARDGGAKLDVSGRLYNLVKDSHQPELKRDWGGFWR